MFEIVLAISMIITTTIGQICLKKASLSREYKLKSWMMLIAGYSLFVLTIALSYFFMKLVPLKYFTIIMSLNYVSVMFGSYLFLNEKLAREKITGTLLVTVGMLVFISDFQIFKGL